MNGRHQINVRAICMIIVDADLIYMRICSIILGDGGNSSLETTASSNNW